MSNKITKSKRGEDVMVEAIFTMFYRLGLIFFNDPKFNNATPGKIADVFFTRPLRLLEKTLGFTSFFSIFVNIGKIILIIVCLWICGKIIAIYIKYIYGTNAGNILNILFNIPDNGRNGRDRAERDKNNSNTVGNNVYDSSNDGNIISSIKTDSSR